MITPAMWDSFVTQTRVNGPQDVEDEMILWADFKTKQLQEINRELLECLMEAVEWAESMDDGEGEGHIVPKWAATIAKAKGE